MIALSDSQIASFWHNSYTRVDGLWCVKVEEKYGFDVALSIDNEVWKVLPKIQARMLKTMGGTGDGLEGLFNCLTTKLKLEGFDYETRRDSDNTGFKIIMKRCPWHDVMVKSGRIALSGKVGSLICNTEYSAWASEFGRDINFKLEEQMMIASQ